MTSGRIRKLAIAVAVYETSVTVVVHEGKALILRRGPGAPWMPGAWNLPGGGVDPGESPLRAAVRELKEEAGIRPGRMRELRTIDMGPELGLLHPFVSEGYRGTPRCADNENDLIDWVGLDDLRRFKFVPFVERVLRMALSGR